MIDNLVQLLISLFLPIIGTPTIKLFRDRDVFLTHEVMPSKAGCKQLGSDAVSFARQEANSIVVKESG